ncbi:cullin-5, partial [Caerostris extrusa]
NNFKLVHQQAVTKAKWRDLFWFVNDVCLWQKRHHTVYNFLKEKLSDFIQKVQWSILVHKEDNALLKAYIAEWRKFFTQCTYLPLPFVELDKTVAEKSASDELMIDFWDQMIFSRIKQRLLNSAMKLVDSERKGEAFDSQLVIGVRSLLCTFAQILMIDYKVIMKISRSHILRLLKLSTG